jgi:hypothetical protein
MARKVTHPVGCRSCGNDMLYVGKLPAIRLQAAVQVFKCQPCKMVHSLTAEIAHAEVDKNVLSAQASKRLGIAAGSVVFGVE